MIVYKDLDIKSKKYNINLFSVLEPVRLPIKTDFTFIDLFAGIGGIRMGFEQAGGECVFTSEWDEAAQRTYEANFGEIPYRII